MVMDLSTYKPTSRFAAGTPYLMYHELEAQGRPLRCNAPGFIRYVVKEEDFRAQITHLKRINLPVLNVGQSLDAGNERYGVVLTFDDGSETDFVVAAPVLQELQANATFFVVAGLVGQRGFLSCGQLRELTNAGFEIGCHSMTHAYLNDLSPKELYVEMVEAKVQLEQITGQRIEHFSCPGGRWTKQVQDIGKRAGYRSIATSEIATNCRSTNPFRLGRVAVKRGTSIASFQRLCRGQGLLVSRMQNIGLSLVKTALGNAFYEKARIACLGMNWRYRQGTGHD